METNVHAARLANLIGHVQPSTEIVTRKTLVAAQEWCRVEKATAAAITASAVYQIRFVDYFTYSFIDFLLPVCVCYC